MRNSNGGELSTCKSGQSHSQKGFNVARKGVKQDFRHKFSQGDNISGIQFLRFVINKNNTNIQIVGLQTAFFCRIKSMAKYDLYEISGQTFLIYMKSMTRKLLKS